jgi:hypothetical protein
MGWRESRLQTVHASLVRPARRGGPGEPAARRRRFTAPPSPAESLLGHGFEGVRRAGDDAVGGISKYRAVSEWPSKIYQARRWWAVLPSFDFATGKIERPSKLPPPKCPPLPAGNPPARASLASVVCTISPSGRGLFPNGFPIVRLVLPRTVAETPVGALPRHIIFSRLPKSKSFKSRSRLVNRSSRAPLRPSVIESPPNRRNHRVARRGALGVPRPFLATISIR